MKRLAVFISSLWILTACGDPIDEPCELTSGALGFGFDDDCRTRCLELEDVICPEGSTTRRAVCAGTEGCEPGSCGDGAICYAFEDPFEEEFYCIPDDFCGSKPTAAEAAQWELVSRQRSDEIRADFAARAKRRSGKTIAPDAVPAPPSEEPELEP